MIPRYAKSLFHCVLALPMQAFAWAVCGPWASVLAVAYWFYSREIVQYQYSIKGDASTATVWYKGWWPGEWDFWSQMDFIAPVVSSLLVVIIGLMI
tara:strand:- start:46344 stop:46631 length:288 start_codon:yes stop_codon:yes gene_type:complete